MFILRFFVLGLFVYAFKLCYLKGDLGPTFIFGFFLFMYSATLVAYLKELTDD